MNSSINLVSNKNDQLEKEARRLGLVRIIALCCLLLVAAFSVIVFIVNFTLPLQAVKKDQQLQLTGIASMHKKLTEFSYVGDRIKNISDIVSKRKKLNDAINSIYEKIPVTSSMDALDVGSNSIGMTISDVSLLSLNQFIDSFIAYKDKNGSIKKVVIQSLTFLAQKGKYTLEVQALMN